MTVLALGFLAAVLLIVLMQAGFVLRLTWLFRTYRRPGHDDRRLPKAAVVVALRGADPFLVENLRALLRQDYPDFEVRVVVDSREDPAWHIVRGLIEEGEPRLRLEVLTERRRTCSLKNSALAQAVRSLDEDCEVVAFCDGDAVGYSHWLRDLVAPLADPTVGLTTGYRWYHASEGRWGSLVRHLWNAGAVVQVWLNRMVWAGSMAIRRSLIEEIDLPGTWEQTLSTDGPIYVLLKKRGYRVAFVPSVMMLNREETSLGSVVQWLRRQMLVAHLYHPGFVLVIVQAVGVTLMQLGALALGVGLAAAGQWIPAACAAGALGLYYGACILFAGLLEWGVRASFRRQGMSPHWLRPAIWVRLPAAVLLTHAIFPYSLLGALRIRSASWRGIRYRVNGPWQVHMVRYKPYREAAAATTVESVL